jgi:hypothetical protein
LGRRFDCHAPGDGYERELPRIWHDANDAASGIRSIQCPYYYAFTYLEVAVPSINDTFRSRMAAWRPERIVLLCVEPRCEGAATALGRAGYKPWLQSQAVLASDGVRVWVTIYKVEPQPV